MRALYSIVSFAFFLLLFHFLSSLSLLYHLSLLASLSLISSSFSPDGLFNPSDDEEWEENGGRKRLRALLGTDGSGGRRRSEGGSRRVLAHIAVSNDPRAKGYVIKRKAKYEDPKKKKETFSCFCYRYCVSSSCPECLLSLSLFSRSLSLSFHSLPERLIPISPLTSVCQRSRCHSRGRITFGRSVSQPQFQQPHTGFTQRVERSLGCVMRKQNTKRKALTSK